MQQRAFRMQLRSGCEAEYKRRHDEIWPELAELLHNAGVRDYSIWLDSKQRLLFAHLWLTDDHRLDQLSNHPLMRKWWASMAALMETHSNDAPVTVELEPMFFQP